MFYAPESTTRTEGAQFHVVHLDAPGTPQMRIAGRFVIDGQGWVFDVEVDTVAQVSDSCL